MQLGTRPLKRAVQRLIQNPLAMKLLDGEVQPGKTVKVDADLKKSTMTFERATYDEGDGEGVIRIISARKATARERMIYEQAH